MDWWRQYRERFEITRHFAFFNHAGVGPLCPDAADAIARYAELSTRQAYLGSKFHARCEQVRAAAADLINAESPDTIAFVKNTSEGLAQVAEGLDWPDGANVVTAAVEFPANVYPWMNLQRRGVELRMVGQVERDGALVVPADDLLAATDGRTALVAISAVQYSTGQAADLEAIGRFCRERSILFCVDAIQQLGCRPLDVQAARIDFLSADGHKWLLGPEGAGIFYCRRELLGRLRPLSVGWMNVVKAQRYDEYDLTLRDDAGRFECGSLNVPGIWGLGAAIDMFNRIGMERVWERIEGLTGRLIEGLVQRGQRVVSLRGAAARSGCVCWAPADGGADPAVVTRLEREERIVIAARVGRYRASPHFYNSEEEIDRLLSALERAG